MNTYKQWKLSDGKNLSKVFNVGITTYPRYFTIENAKVVDKVISLELRQSLVADLTIFRMADVLDFEVKGILDASGNVIDQPLNYTVSGAFGYFNELSWFHANSRYNTQTLNFYLKDNFRGTVQINIIGKYTGLTVMGTYVVK